MHLSISIQALGTANAMNDTTLSIERGPEAMNK